MAKEKIYDFGSLGKWSHSTLVNNLTYNIDDIAECKPIKNTFNKLIKDLGEHPKYANKFTHMSGDYYDTEYFHKWRPVWTLSLGKLLKIISKFRVDCVKYEEKEKVYYNDYRKYIEAIVKLAKKLNIEKL